MPNEPMTLGEMRKHGIRRLVIICQAGGCGHCAVMEMSPIQTVFRSNRFGFTPDARSVGHRTPTRSPIGEKRMPPVKRVPNNAGALVRHRSSNIAATRSRTARKSAIRCACREGGLPVAAA